MSDHRYTAIFGGALLTATVATVAVYRMVGAAATPKHEATQTVIVAVRDVPAGVPVPREALGVASWPVRVAPAESFAAADSVIGRVTRVPLMSGEPVLTTRLAVRGAAPGLEGTIDPARRAMAVRVNEAASVSGLVRSNSRVDVLMAGRADGGTQPTARVLMTDVRVLGVGSVRPPESPTGASEPTPANNMAAAIVTLEVTPGQAEQLAAAESQGAIQVVLRGYGSTGDPIGASSYAGRADLPARVTPAPTGLGVGTPVSAPARAPVRAPVHVAARPVPSDASEPAPAEPTRPEPAVIQVYRGGNVTTLRMDAAGASPTAVSGGGGGRGGGTNPPRAVRMADAHGGIRVTP